VTTLEEARKIYYQWSTPEQIEKYGFMAIEVAPLLN
jgi:ASC-1-like (ASCH) protein